jgi:fibronectin type 3 domain-containing protein
MYTLSIKSFLKIILIVLTLFLCFQVNSYARNVSLEWDANTEPDLDHYVIYWGTSSGNYTNNSENIDKSLTTYTATNLSDNKTYYFVATAVDTEEFESDYSNEVESPKISFSSVTISVISTTNKKVTLEWDANTEPDLDHYVIYWGTSSGNYTNNSENRGEFIGRNDTTYTVTDLNLDQYTYYFVAKAFNNIGAESDYSNEINTGE